MNKFFTTRLSLAQKILFIKQLDVLMRGGVVLHASLGLMKQQTNSKAVDLVLGQVLSDVENGLSLARSLANSKHAFGGLIVHLIGIGEASGNLGNNLQYLASTLKKQQLLRRKIIGAAVYPVFIIIATLVMVLMLVLFIFPKIMPVFASIHYQLPWTTRSLIFANNLVKHHGLAMLAVVIAAAVGFFLLLKTERFSSWCQKACIKTPFVSRLVKTYHTASICRTLGLLIGTAPGVVEAFTVTSGTIGNVLYKQELLDIGAKINKGANISSSISQERGLFPLMVAQMLAVGEKTGKLGETFLYLAQHYEEEMDEMAKNLSTVVEPALLLFMGILVGFVAISIITPIYGITQHLTPK